MRPALLLTPAVAALALGSLAGCGGSSAALAESDQALYAAEAERDSLRGVIAAQDEAVVAYRDSLATLRRNLPRRRGTPAPPPAAERPVREDVRRPDVAFADTLYADELFAPASANLTGDGEALLDRVAYELGRAAPDRRVRVEGHGDATPPGPTIRDRYPSNWELSSARAAAVVRYLVGRGMAENRFEVVGLAATRTVAPDDTPAGRARNRRIVVVAQ